MATQLQCHRMLALSQASSSPFPQRLRSLSTSISTFKTYKKEGLLNTLSLEKSCAATRRKTSKLIVSSSTASPYLDSWKPDNSAKQPSLSDIIWPSAGAFAAMAVLGKMDQMLVQKGVSMSVAPLGAVCAILFTTPSAPAARLYNVFMAQICCAAIGVLAFSVLGPGWLARSTALAASIAFMICTRSLHPPAASLPLLFIDGAKFHRLNFWYALFPGATGCILLCLIALDPFQNAPRLHKQCH